MVSETLQAFLDSAPEWILNLPDFLYDFCYSFFKCFIHDARYKHFLTGIGNTLKLTFFALLLGIVLGIVIALVRVTWDKRGLEMQKGPARTFLKIGNSLSKFYLTVIRGTPVIVQLLIIFYIFMGSSNNKVLAGVLAFGINSGAYVAEIFRGGIMSVDDGQTEAGRSLGFNYVQTMKIIVLPQAFKNVLPTLVNEFITLIKETAVAGYIGLTDLTYAGNIVRGVTFEPYLPLFGVALVYLGLVMLLTWLAGKLERRLRNSER